MARFQITRDEKGDPTHVLVDDGFCIRSGPFDPETDGWMLNQLDPHDFPAIQTGQDMLFLVQEVNRLRRELFYSKGNTDFHRKAAGFGNGV